MLKRLKILIMDYSNLLEKTFLDLTTDQSIIDQILSETDKDFFLKNVSLEGRFVTFLELSELTNDKELQQEVKRQFPNMFDE